MDTLLQDLRTTLRNVLRSPGFAAAAILTTGLGIGVNTAIFSVVHGVLLSPLPYAHPDRLAFIWKDFSTNFKQGPLSPKEATDLKREAFHFDAIGGIWSVTGTLVGEGPPAALRVGRVTSNFLEILGVAPMRGRWLTLDDEREGPGNMVISWGLWQRLFGGAEVLGRRVQIEGGWGMDTNHYTVVGIMPPDFEMLLPDPSVPRTVDAWVPFQGRWAESNGSYLRTIARLAPDASLATAQEQVERYGRAAGVSGRRLYAVPLHAEVVGEARPVLLVLLGAVVCVLLIACISVAGLLLVRAQQRRKEMSIRLALGAMPGRLARLLLTEGFILAALGGLLGVALAYVGLRVLPLLDSGTLPRGSHATLNGAVLLFSAIVSLASGLVFGLAPLADAGRHNLDAVLKAGGRGGTVAMQQRTRRILVLAEISLSVMLLIGAGLLIRTFFNLHAFNPGFSGERVLTFRVPVSGERYEQTLTLPNDLERALRGMPGVEAAGVINQLPLDDDPNYGLAFWTRATVAGHEPAPLADARIVSPGYLPTVQAQLVAGRWFTDRDDATQRMALIVDERLASRAWPNVDPIGQELLLGSRDGSSWAQVVGVVRHLRHHRLSEEVREQIFIPYTQRGRNQLAVAVRSGLATDALLRGVTARLRELDPNLAPAQARPLDALLARSRAKARFSMVLASVFAGLSLLLACLSLYGVLSYSVAQRTQEFGLRAALGARSSDLITMVVGQGVVLAALGIVLGLIGAGLAARSIQRLLFGITPFDPLTFIGVPVIVGVTALVACYLPARRAARVDPMVALRGE